MAFTWRLALREGSIGGGRVSVISEKLVPGSYLTNANEERRRGCLSHTFATRASSSTGFRTAQPDRRTSVLW